MSLINLISYTVQNAFEFNNIFIYHFPFNADIFCVTCYSRLLYSSQLNQFARNVVSQCVFITNTQDQSILETYQRVLRALSSSYLYKYMSVICFAKVLLRIFLQSLKVRSFFHAFSFLELTLLEHWQISVIILYKKEQ